MVWDGGLDGFSIYHARELVDISGGLYNQPTSELGGTTRFPCDPSRRGVPEQRGRGLQRPCVAGDVGPPSEDLPGRKCVQGV
jgi:hypothetical protein